jgi:energy-coupling factor transporter ATP-binding protein EcfA2
MVGVGPLIRLQDVDYTYPRGERPALDSVSLEIPAGQFCALLGANGAGKSTLCYALTGFIPHFYRGRLAGRLQVAGMNVAETPLAQLAGRIGLVFANPFNQITGAKFTVREEVAFGLENLGIPRQEMEARIARALEMTDIAGLADRSPYNLSGGQQQRLAIASVLAMEPQVLVLDEPAAQLDPAGAAALFAVLHTLSARQETTVVLATHKVERVARFAGRAVILQQGKVVADGPPLELLADPALAGYGVAPTRYTAAAHLARERGLADGSGPLPVTLEQAEAFFR